MILCRPTCVLRELWNGKFASHGGIRRTAFRNHTWLGFALALESDAVGREFAQTLCAIQTSEYVEQQEEAGDALNDQKRCTYWIEEQAHNAKEKQHPKAKCDSARDSDPPIHVPESVLRERRFDVAVLGSVESNVGSAVADVMQYLAGVDSSRRKDDLVLIVTIAIGDLKFQLLQQRRAVDVFAAAK